MGFVEGSLFGLTALVSFRIWPTTPEFDVITSSEKISNHIEV